MDEPTPEVKPDINSALRTIDAMLDGFLAQLPNFVLALVVIVAFYFVAKGVRGLVHRTTARGRHPNVGLVVGRLAQWGMLILGLLVALAVAAPSVKPVNILSMLGVGSIAIGFAFKDVLQNFLAGILILLRQPFRVGDQIIFKGFEGTVEDINARATLIKTYDGRRVVIPNGELFTNSVLVNTAYPVRRSEYDVGIGYGDDLARAEEILLKTVKAVDGVVANPAPDVLTWDLAASTVNIRVRWWTKSKRTEVVKIKAKVLRAIKEALTEAQIDIAYPTQVVLFHDQTEESDGDRTRQREGWPAGDDPPPPRRRLNEVPDLADALAALAELARRQSNGATDHANGADRDEKRERRA